MFRKIFNNISGLCENINWKNIRSCLDEVCGHSYESDDDDEELVSDLLKAEETSQKKLTEGDPIDSEGKSDDDDDDEESEEGSDESGVEDKVNVDENTGLLSTEKAIKKTTKKHPLRSPWYYYVIKNCGRLIVGGGVFLSYIASLVIKNALLSGQTEITADISYESIFGENNTLIDSRCAFTGTCNNTYSAFVNATNDFASWDDYQQVKNHFYLLSLIVPVMPILLYQLAGSGYRCLSLIKDGCARDKLKKISGAANYTHYKTRYFNKRIPRPRFLLVFGQFALRAGLYLGIGYALSQLVAALADKKYALNDISDSEWEFCTNTAIEFCHATLKSVFNATFEEAAGGSSIIHPLMSQNGCIFFPKEGSFQQHFMKVFNQKCGIKSSPEENLASYSNGSFLFGLIAYLLDIGVHGIYDLYTYFYSVKGKAKLLNIEEELSFDLKEPDPDPDNYLYISNNTSFLNQHTRRQTFQPALLNSLKLNFDIGYVVRSIKSTEFQCLGEKFIRQYDSVNASSNGRPLESLFGTDCLCYGVFTNMSAISGVLGYSEKGTYDKIWSKSKIIINQITHFRSYLLEGKEEVLKSNDNKAALGILLLASEIELFSVIRDTACFLLNRATEKKYKPKGSGENPVKKLKKLVWVSEAMKRKSFDGCENILQRMESSAVFKTLDCAIPDSEHKMKEAKREIKVGLKCDNTVREMIGKLAPSTSFLDMEVDDDQKEIIVEREVAFDGQSVTLEEFKRRALNERKRLGNLKREMEEDGFSEKKKEENIEIEVSSAEEESEGEGEEEEGEYECEYDSDDSSGHGVELKQYVP